MITNHLRRKLIQGLASAVIVGMFRSKSSYAQMTKLNDSENAWTVGGSNFHAIYDSKELRSSFRQFLLNVFSIYPADPFDSLIADITKSFAHDRDIFLSGQSRLHEIKPIGSELTHALPALFHQTKTIGEQLCRATNLSEIDGYMEIGSKGGYIAAIKSKLKVKGDLILLNSTPPSYAPIDILERRQLTKFGRFLNLGNYEPISEASVKTAALDLVFNPIGFHHSPIENRDGFVRSIRRCLRDGGFLVVRDHDVNSQAMNHMVALAHDVFNMGLGNAWSYNQNEIRNFTSVAELSDYLAKFGFKPVGTAIYQDGDPTQNALLTFVAS